MENNKKQKTEDVINTDGGVFSTRLEALISAALRDGVLTGQEKAILKKRVEKEGEDWEEVEMIINARLAERQPTPQIEKGVGKNFAGENDKVGKPQTQKVVKEAFFPQIYKGHPEDKDKSCLEIPEGVTEIDEFAFSLSSNLRNVTIRSKQLKKIGRFAFFRCKKMEAISFPNGMEKIVIDISALRGSVKVFLPASMIIVKGFNIIDNIYCFSPQLEEMEELCNDNRITSLYVLPDYLENYKSQAIAEGIEKKIRILPMPDEYLYFYDN